MSDQNATQPAPMIPQSMEKAGVAWATAGAKARVQNHLWFIECGKFVTNAPKAFTAKADQFKASNVAIDLCLTRYVEIRTSIGTALSTIGKDKSHFKALLERLAREDEVAVKFFGPIPDGEVPASLQQTYDSLSDKAASTRKKADPAVETAIETSTAQTTGAPVVVAASVTTKATPKSVYDAAEILIGELESMGKKGVPFLAKLAARIVDGK